MIHKNTNFGALENVTVLEFGKGDIMVTHGKGEKYQSVHFKTSEPFVIGQVHKNREGATSDDFKSEVIMTFDSPNSIDVVMEYLQIAKSELVNETPINKPITYSSEMYNALKELLRFKAELRHVMGDKLQSPENFLKAMDEAEKVIEKANNKT